MYEERADHKETTLRVRPTLDQLLVELVDCHDHNDSDNDDVVVGGWGRREGNNCVSGALNSPYHSHRER
jgi:hypothetical protein